MLGMVDELILAHLYHRNEYRDRCIGPASSVLLVPSHVARAPSHNGTACLGHQGACRPGKTRPENSKPEEVAADCQTGCC